MVLAASAVSRFEASFHGIEQIGSSNYTHFWMPTPMVRTSAHLNSQLFVHVDLCGDGTKCPPPGHPQPASACLTELNGGPWVSTTTHLPANTVIRLNDSATRGFGGIVLNAGDNTTATARFQDWVVDATGAVRLLTPGKAMSAPVVGLPPMLQIAYFMDSPAAVLKTEAGEVVLTQFYGYIDGKTQGCTEVSRGCYSVVTLSSTDHGAR